MKELGALNLKGSKEADGLQKGGLPKAPRIDLEFSKRFAMSCLENSGG